MRVNARFDDDLSQRMAYLTRATNMGVSDVIKSSILFYYESVRGREAPQLTHLSQWIGKTGSGRVDVSSAYKSLLTDSLAEKHGKSAGAMVTAAAKVRNPRQASLPSAVPPQSTP
jgi:hypothetical protein